MVHTGTWQNSNYGWKSDGLFGLGPGHAVLPTNITHLSRAIPPQDSEGRPQVVYYQAGVGTGWSTVEHLWGGGTGEGLAENIREGYAFLVNNYQDGDKIVLLGFSRGAYTARSIGGLIGDFGLLDKRKNGMEFFYQFFVSYYALFIFCNPFRIVILLTPLHRRIGSTLARKSISSSSQRT